MGGRNEEQDALHRSIYVALLYRVMQSIKSLYT